MRTRPVLTRVAAWAAAAVIAAALVAHDSRPPERLTYVGVPYDPALATDHVFFISGDATGLYPGGTVSLPLTVTNPNVAAILVNTLTVAVTGTDRPACPPTGSNPVSGGYTGPPFVVAGNDGTATVTVPLTMPHAAGDECRGTTFTLTFGGTAVNVEGTPGSKVVNVGPYGQGNLKFQPGVWISVGVDVRLNSPEAFPVAIDVTGGTVTMPVKCSNGALAAGSPLTLPFPDQHFTVPPGSKDWIPATSGGMASGYQLAVQVPAMCAGIGTGQMKNAGNDFLTATVGASDTPVSFKWHFALPAGKGFADVNCSDPAANPGNGIPDCKAGWSGKVDP
ncbi:MAG TPA: hypothetical protein VNN79_08835 [Actinomycetota bacterium]|nr:hypothetical protein [Actinomycetota bacterium]